MLRSLCFLIVSMVCLGSIGCGAECSDLTPKQCAKRSDCGLSRMWVEDRRGKYEKLHCSSR